MLTLNRHACKVYLTTATMKPRAIFSSKTITEIEVGGEWHALGQMSLIGSSKWTIRNSAGDVIVRCSGIQAFQVR